MSIRKRAAAAYRPRVGESVLDTRTGRTGIYMDTIGGEHYLRPPEGGCEWTARPEHVTPDGPAGDTGGAETDAEPSARRRPGNRADPPPPDGDAAENRARLSARLAARNRNSRLNESQVA
ncbi:hypothetical protein ACFC58_36690 [Kitasatospora purpeofusca]|uniref:hypothetical protein n=1 Tax=Kitasatospora purpeofusca TaxID=67352 RepID=UPI0035DD77DD